MEIVLPIQVKKIIADLEAAGYEAYAVGGCVRDSILGRRPEDWDITTSARPEQTKALFRRTVDTGLQHGTITVIIDGVGYEVTTYRIDGEYQDSRHPSEVLFTASLTEDLKRRDFTINAMAYNEKAGLIDIFDGAGDLKAGRIRCVGAARERFTEDALRILRAVRFSAQLGFTIEAETQQAIRQQAASLSRISAERIQVEVVKMLTSPHPQYLEQAWQLGITAVIMPEFDAMMATEQNNPHHCYNVGAHTLTALQQVESDKVLRLAVLLHDIGKPDTRSTDESGIDHFYGHAETGREIAGRILRRWRFDNDTRGKVKELIKYHDYHPPLTETGVRRMIHKVSPELFPLLLQVQRADILAQSDYQRTEKLADLTRLETIYRGIQERAECLSLKDLAVTGRDLIENGMQPGPQLGAVLNQLLEYVLEHPDQNQKDSLLEYVRRL